ncbi:MAG TPA: hypothetical protein VGB13_04330, partial [Candidatus Krumholzibacteria bacterium]
MKRQGWILLCGLLAATAAPACSFSAWGQRSDTRKYLDRLNAPILAVSEDERAYKIYFEAHDCIDVSDPRLAAASTRLDPYSSTFQEAIGWAGDPAQQEAVELILKKNQRGLNATQRKLFGLPYGTYDVDDDLVINDFVVYVHDDLLFDREDAYLARYQELTHLLRAEAFRRAEEGNADGACEAILGMARMARQLCDQRFYDEKHLGMTLLLECFVQIRDFMWFYRDKLSIENFRTIAIELERLGLERIEMPSGEELIGEQLIEQIFGPDNRVDKQKFPEVMASFDSYGSPLKRFQAVAYWQQVVDQHASKREVETALKDAVANWRLRWRLPLHSSLVPDSEFAKLDDLKYAAVKRPIRDLQNLFELRVPLATQLNGTATAAGIHAYLVREGAKLVVGQSANEATVPARLAQIQPAFVNYESTLTDVYASLEDKLHFAVIRNTDPRFAHDGYRIETPEGDIRLFEFWPLLYSVGPDRAENLGQSLIHNSKPELGDKCDVIFFPNVD